MTVPSPPSAELHEPPVPTHRVLIVGLVGVGFLVAAFILGLVTGAPRRGFDPHSADGPRALLAAIGLLIAGCAVSMRPSWYGGWLCAAVAGLLGYGLGGPKPHGTEWYVSPPRDWFAGVPNSWDSIQLFFGVAAGVGPRRCDLDAAADEGGQGIHADLGGIPLRGHPVRDHVAAADPVDGRSILEAAR